MRAFLEKLKPSPTPSIIKNASPETEVNHLINSIRIWKKKACIQYWFESKCIYRLIHSADNSAYRIGTSPLAQISQQPCAGSRATWGEAGAVCAVRIDCGPLLRSPPAGACQAPWLIHVKYQCQGHCQYRASCLCMPAGEDRLRAGVGIAPGRGRAGEGQGDGKLWAGGGGGRRSRQGEGRLWVGNGKVPGRGRTALCRGRTSYRQGVEGSRQGEVRVWAGGGQGLGRGMEISRQLEGRLWAGEGRLHAGEGRLWAGGGQTLGRLWMGVRKAPGRKKARSGHIFFMTNINAAYRDILIVAWAGSWLALACEVPDQRVPVLSWVAPRPWPRSGESTHSVCELLREWHH